MRPKWQSLWKTEDWWAVWLGLGIIAFAVLLYALGYADSLGRFAAKPPAWETFSAVINHFAACWLGYVLLFAAFLTVFSLSTTAIGLSPKRYVPGFTVIFLASIVVLVLSSSKIAKQYNLEAPLVALILGLAVSNVFKLPQWLDASLRTEYYIKTGIVLLGATLPLTLILSAGPIAFLQATIVSTVTWLTIYLAATRIFKQEPQFGAVMGAGGSVCGVSAAIAVGAAVKAKKEHVAIAISLVTIWAIVMIFFIPLASRALHLQTAVAGAWVGTSEFADAAGFAAAAAYSPPKPDGLEDAVRAVGAGNAAPKQVELAKTARFYDAENAIRTFTLMKVIGRDVWIGIWCFILSIVAVVFWEKKEGERSAHVRAGVIWERFPKFVIGFIIASVVMTFFVKWHGAESGKAFDALNHDLLTPITTLRTWAFVFAFLCIGLTTRFKDLTKFGWQPFWAFTIGVLINVPLGFLLSVYVFKDFWLRVGQ